MKNGKQQKGEGGGVRIVETGIQWYAMFDNGQKTLVPLQGDECAGISFGNMRRE